MGRLEELLSELERLAFKFEQDYDGEQAHMDADRALLKYIDNPRVSKLHDELAVYYS